RSSVGRNVELHVSSPEASVEIEGNHTELQQCLLNLCLNGAQAMPDGGELRMDAELFSLDEDFFEGDDVRAPGRYLRIQIRDTGMGMSEDVRSRLFQPFFTTKEKGTGLGLLSCRRILANHQGYLRLASEPGKGTTFSLYLPMRLNEELLGAGDIPHGRGERVLIVMERESKMVLLRDIIESHRYTISAAENGAVAVQSLDADGLPDVVLMDGQMNLTTGVLTASKLLEMDYRGPLILIAAPASREEIEHDLPPLPNIRFIDKPVNSDELLAVLADELKRSAPNC
ncbi:MAG: ATP-binding protein, partial [Dokdonella sp.]|uniref:ATP-binding protein n=1 Tax=Dokdonella sp. TaxID=2291710 RepID=UPI003262DB47